jgi:site-specific recombinase XerD
MPRPSKPIIVALTRFEPARAPAALTPENVGERLQEALLALWNRLESPHSRAAYRADWRRFCDWAALHNVHPLAATALHVQQYIAWMRDRGNSKATRARALASLRATYGALVIGFSDMPGVMPSNPAREVANLRVGSEPKTPWLSEPELGLLLTEPVANATWQARRDWLIVACLAGLGWRRAEVASLQRDQLIAAPGGFTARVRAKGGKIGYVPVPIWLGEEIDAWCKSQEITAGPVFPRAPGVAVSISTTLVWKAVKRAAAVAGIDETRATPHALRRSFATITGQHGVSIEDRQAAMLHASKTTTERYDKASKLPSQAPGEALRSLITRNQKPLP